MSSKKSIRSRSLALALVALAVLSKVEFAEAQAAYRLSGTPRVLEDLGSVLQTATQEHQVMYRTTSGERHLQLYYNTFGYAVMDVVDINLETSTYFKSKFLEAYGRPGAQCHVYYPANNKIYIGSSDPGGFSEFDPVTGATRFVRKLEYKGSQYCEIGEDGWIYIGQVTSVSSTTGQIRRGAGVERYHPLTQQWQDMGLMDPSFSGALQYAYTIGADARYLYVGLGQLPWYLAVYDTQATANPVKLYWKDDGDTQGTMQRGLDGAWYYTRFNSAAAASPTNPWYKKYYKMVNGVPVEISTPPQLVHWSQHGNTFSDQSVFLQYFNTELNLDAAYPNSANGGTAVIGWKIDGGPLKSATLSGFSLKPSTIKRLYSWPGAQNRMLGWASEYGLVFSFNPATLELKGLGYPQRSLYHASFDGGTVYFSGYPASTLRYDSARPWTLSGSTLNISASEINPYQIALRGGDEAGNWVGKYHYYSALGADGMLYVASHHERDSVGGGLGWYAPGDAASTGLRKPFLTNDVRDLLAVNSGTKILYSSNDTANIEGKLFVLDTATKKIERVFNPVSSNVSLDKVVEVQPGIVVGITATKYYRANVLTGETEWVKDLGGVPFSGVAPYDRRLTFGPDNFVWLFINQRLCRIDPISGTIEVVVESLPVTNLLFHGADLYFYGDTKIRRIKGLLEKVGLLPLPPSNLRINLIASP